MDSCASAGAHLESRSAATLRAGNALIDGTCRLPAYTHSFVQHLWKTLVQPVALYGVELFDWQGQDIKRFESLQVGQWRRLLHMGGRSPHDAVATFMGCARSCTVEWRVRRVGLLLRLLSAPPESWQHVALLYFVSSDHEWLTAAVADLQIVLPGVQLYASVDTPRPCVRSSCLNVDGQRMTAQPNGPGTSSDAEPRLAVCRFIKTTTMSLRSSLLRERETELLQRITERSLAEPFSMSLPLAAKLRSGGPPIATILDWIGPLCHVQAVIGFFSGDFFLGRYAGNYFAKQLLPVSVRHRAELES